jgi:hypothetical protein
VSERERDQVQQRAQQPSQVAYVAINKSNKKKKPPGTAEGTAAVSGRLRGKCQAAAVVAMTACGEALKSVFAVSVEDRREVLFVSTAGLSIKQVEESDLWY